MTSGRSVSAAEVPPRLPAAAWLASLRGWRRIVAAVALGAVATAAMPPWQLLPAMLVGLVGLVWLLDGRLVPDAKRPLRGALGDGLAWGFGHFAAGTWWMVEAYFVPPATFAALGPPMVTGLAAVLGLFIAGTACAHVAVVRRHSACLRGWRRVAVLALSWTAFEWLRGHVFTGLPWNPAGHVWAFHVAPLQVVSATGVYGLSLLTVLALAMPATLADRVVGRWRPTAAAIAVAGMVIAAGAWRIETTRTSPGLDAPVLRLVQPNIPQGEKWLSRLRAVHFEQLLAMSVEARPATVRHVIWPETATAFLLAQSPDYLRAARRAIPPGGYLLTGAPRGPLTVDETRRAGALADMHPVWNSLHVVDGEGAIRATFDKAHLVPFGEYLPLRAWIPLSDTIGRGSFEAGPGPRTLRVEGLPPVGVAICYEAIFPGAIVDATDRPSWILNVTNDSWFGTSSGPHQHLASARLRAIEEGLPVIRVANTGISAVIDANGRVGASLGMGAKGVIDAALPPALPPTIFARFGSLPLVALWLSMAIVTFASRRF